MKNKNMKKLILAVSLLSAISGSVWADDARKPAEPSAQTATEQAGGFGSGNGVGVGGGFGNPNANNGPAMHNNGRGSETFGGGFTQQRSPGAGPLSSNPGAGTGPAPTMKAPSSFR